MALTFTERHFGVQGDRKVWHGSIDFDTGYVTGGEPIAAANFGLSVIEHVQVNTEDGDDNIQPVYDHASSTIQLIVSGTGAEAANTSDQSGVKIGAVVTGY